MGAVAVSEERGRGDATLQQVVTFELPSRYLSVIFFFFCFFNFVLCIFLSLSFSALLNSVCFTLSV